MRRAFQILGLSGLVVTGLASPRAFGKDLDEGTQADPHHNTEEPKEAEQPAPVIEPSGATGTPAETTLAPPPSAVIPPSVAPKFGDMTVSGYFRGGFGASNQKGRMTCFQLSNPQGLIVEVSARQRVRGVVRDALHDGGVRRG